MAEKIKRHLRLLVQALFVILTNGYVKGFMDGAIYRGRLKSFCVPGLNCYSCPGALGACPLGSLQAALADKKLHIPFFVTGFLFFVGALFGRFVCGWLCPFGLVQDLLYKIPFRVKRKRLPLHGFLKNIKYGALLFLVLLFPLLLRNSYGVGTPWFCKLVCPSGTLFGAVPLMAVNEGLRQAAGGLFFWKLTVLTAVILAAVAVYRPFCQYLCPLGAFYGLFNKVSLVRLQLDEEKCTKCGGCRRACPVDIPAYETPNSAECIRCGACVNNCSEKALHMRRIIDKK